MFAGAGRTAVKSFGESRGLPALAELESKAPPDLFAKVGEGRELVVLAKVSERAELMGPGVDFEEGKEVELLASHGESCSKLGGEYDSTGVVALPGVEELSGFSARAGVLVAFLEGV